MEERVVPSPLIYSDVRPQGIKSRQRMVKFTPNTAGPYTASGNNTIRFYLNSNSFLDPFETYLKVQVTFDATDLYGSANVAIGDAKTKYSRVAEHFCIDKCASAVFNRMVIYVGSNELERIEEYDVLANILNDVEFSGERGFSHFHEGRAAGQPGTSNLNGNFPSGAFTPTIPPTYSVIQNGVDLTLTHNGLVSDRWYKSCDVESINQVVGNVSYNTKYRFRYDYNIKQATTIVVNYCIPLYSGILGILMPKNNIKYLPMQFLPNLGLELTLNGAFVKTTVANLAVDYSITNCELFTTLMDFDELVTEQIKQMIAQEGLLIHTHSFYTTFIDAIPYNAAGTSITSNWHINLGFKSLKSIFVVFTPTLGRTGAVYYKSGRSGLGVSKFQVKIGSDYYPSLPIEATPSTHQHTDMYINLLKAIKRFHDPALDMQFSIGSYDYLCVLADNSTVTYDGGVLVANSPPLSGAIYGIDLDSVSDDDNVISGINTIINRPFEIQMTYIPETQNYASVDAIALCLYDMMINIKPNLEVIAIGRT